MVSIKTEDYASHVMRDSDAANTCLIVDGSNIATSGQPQFGERDRSPTICSDFSFLYMRSHRHRNVPEAQTRIFKFECDRQVTLLAEAMNVLKMTEFWREKILQVFLQERKFPHFSICLRMWME